MPAEICFIANVQCTPTAQLGGAASICKASCFAVVVRCGCGQGERGVRSREFERWRCTYYRPARRCPTQKAAGRADAAQRPGQQRAGCGASRPWLHALSTSLAYTLLSVHSACRTGLPAGRRGHLHAAERRQARRKRSSKRLMHPCAATASPRRHV